LAHLPVHCAHARHAHGPPRSSLSRAKTGSRAYFCDTASLAGAREVGTPVHVDARNRRYPCP
jgi:hypothetical protein